MEIVYFLIAVGVIAVGLFWFVGKSSRERKKRNSTSKNSRHAAPMYQSKSAAHVMQHGHDGHASAAKERDIWRGRRRHATDHAGIRGPATGTINASRVVFDDEVSDAQQESEELSMTTIEFRAEPQYSPKAAQGK